MKEFLERIIDPALMARAKQLDSELLGFTQVTRVPIGSIVEYYQGSSIRTDSAILPSLTRDQVAKLLECSHAELGRLLRERRAPLPVRIDGAILWYRDEVEAARPQVQKILAGRRR